MLNNLNLERLHTFVVAGRARTFAEAARERGVSVSAISQQVRGLEAQLGHALFERVGRHARLTEEGKALHRVAAAHLVALEEAVQQLGRAQGAVAGVVTVGSPRTFGVKWLVPRLPGLLAAHPELSLRLDFDVPSALERKLLDGALDLAVMVRPTELPGLESVLLTQERFVAVAAPAFLERHRDRSEAALRAWRWLVFDRDRPMHDAWWRATFGKKAPVVPVAAQVPSLELLEGLAEAAAGAVVLPDYLVDEALRAGRLALVPVAAKKTAVNGLFLAWRAGVVDTARFRAVRAALTSPAPAARRPRSKTALQYK